MLSDLQSHLERELKRSIFHLGRVDDWYCAGCDVPLDIDRRPPCRVDAYLNGEPLAYKVLCRTCLDKRGGAEAIRLDVKAAWFSRNPDRLDGDHVPPATQAMLPGTRPDPVQVDRITVEVI